MAERDALQSLVNDLAALAANDGFGFITNDLLDRLFAAAEARTIEDADLDDATRAYFDGAAKDDSP